MTNVLMSGHLAVRNKLHTVLLHNDGVSNVLILSGNCC